MDIDGFGFFPGALDPDAQAELLSLILEAVETAPFYTACTPGGQPLSVRMTNLGPLGWVSDRGGYRYQSHHPVTGRPWPAMPAALFDLWRRFTADETAPDACLVNLYGPDARMGLHQDRDEADLAAPVLSVSLGDTALFRLGGRQRRDPTRSMRLASGDLCVLSGPARMAYHGVDRVLSGSSRLVPGGGRVNLTLRRAAPSAARAGD